jgi:hypothetical protein
MTPIEHINPASPSNWVRRIEDKRRQQKDPHRQSPEQGRQPHDQKHPPGQDPDGRTHIIDDLA